MGPCGGRGRRRSAGDQRGNHRGDHREHGNDLNGGGLGLGLADVVLQDIQLITEDHLVGNDETGAADEGAVEIAAILQRRGKGLNNDPPQRFAGILVHVLGRGFTRGDNHGKHAGEQCAQAGAHEADFHVGDEEGADQRADALADHTAAADGRGDRGAGFLFNTVGNQRVDRNLHHVESGEGEHIADANNQSAGRAAQRPEADAIHESAGEDPRRAAAPLAGGAVGQSADEQGDENGGDGACGVDGAEHGGGVFDAQIAQTLRNQDGHRAVEGDAG